MPLHSPGGSTRQWARGDICSVCNHLFLTISSRIFFYNFLQYECLSKMLIKDSFIRWNLNRLVIICMQNVYTSDSHKFSLLQIAEDNPSWKNPLQRPPPETSLTLTLTLTLILILNSNPNPKLGYCFLGAVSPGGRVTSAHQYCTTTMRCYSKFCVTIHTRTLRTHDKKVARRAVSRDLYEFVLSFFVTRA